MTNQTEINDISEFDAEQNPEQQEENIELSEEARVAFALYLNVLKGGKVTPQGTIVPALNIHQLSRTAEVNPRQVSKSFDRLRTKGFLNNNDDGELFIPDIIEFEDWLKQEGAAID